jgi:hypothetical protein
MKKYEMPYPECDTCKTLEDCKNVEVALDGLGSNMPPDNCPQPIIVLKQTLHKHQLRNQKS